MANTKEPPYVKTDLRGFNSLVGGMPVGSLFGLFGMPASNKSILSTQMAWTFLKYGANALLFDTEGGAGDFALGPWVDAFNKRYDSQIVTNRVEFDFDTAAWTFQNPPEKTNTFFVVDARDIITVLKIHGYKMRLEISSPQVKFRKVCPKCRQEIKKREPPFKCETCGLAPEMIEEKDAGGKVNVRYDTDQEPKLMPAIELNISKTPIGRLVAENNIKYISYDSITNPTEIYVSGGLNFPGRDDVNGLWFQQIQSLASRYKITSFGLFHLSINPTSIYDKYGHPIGGKSVGHNFKFVTLLRRLQGAMGTPFSTKAEKINVRKMFNMRHPRKTPFGTSSDLVMGDSGLTDSEVAQFDDE